MAYHKFKDDYLDKLLQSYFGAEFFNPNHSEVQQYFNSFREEISHSKTKIITIAGTNGKGQTSHYINDILVSQGFKTGLWTSPHVLSVTERFKFNDQNIDHDNLKEVFERVYSKDFKLSYYEFLFYCFCSIATKRELDYIILEVGLGGRLDAVNFLDADYTLLTSISKDHEEFLGSSLTGILQEKLGVCRAPAPHFSALSQSFLRKRQGEILKGHHFIDLFESGVLLEDDDYFLRNKLLALYFTTYLQEGVLSREELISKASEFSCTVTKGRQEEVTIKDIKFIFIGAHNIDGIRKMRDFFLSKKQSEKSHLLCAFSKRKIEDVETSIEIFKSSPCLWESINFTSFDHLKALDLQSIPMSDDYEICGDWKSYLDEVINSKKGQWIVTGSYYFIGEVQKYLNTRFNLF
ncbi:putative folylpolyglutamate synthase [Halobacteriovorax marinus SJ]|uniref:Folylpolyglutamate synthase n=1 Tax=Halobacteriovorax marinus (strain ATCC BAA-682 / DSM 15412 / SJ) TaxID=862908 RepID=E1X2D6_HALMS|nr:Mur ligase family protein [Halobacteriovorax marinus]CBW26703.1 putative folylpolyglutamate synthase [Halobacteriovorax marinus SJ]